MGDSCGSLLIMWVIKGSHETMKFSCKCLQRSSHKAVFWSDRKTFWSRSYRPLVAFKRMQILVPRHWLPFPDPEAIIVHVHHLCCLWIKHMLQKTTSTRTLHSISGTFEMLRIQNSENTFDKVPFSSVCVDCSEEQIKLRHTDYIWGIADWNSCNL